MASSSAGIADSRPLLAGLGAAASLIAAVAVLAVVGPSLVGFSGDSGAPAVLPGGDLPFDESSLRSAATSAAGPAARTPSRTGERFVAGGGGRGREVSGTRGRVEKGAGGAGGLAGASTTVPRPAPPQDPRQDPPGPGGDPGLRESLARGLQAAVGGAGATFERLVTSASGGLSNVNPVLGEVARRAARSSADGARAAGQAAADLVRALPDPSPPLN